MKKFLSLAVTALLALSAQADDIKYLNFRTLDGQETSLPIENGLTITFQDGKIVGQAVGYMPKDALLAELFKAVK